MTSSGVFSAFRRVASLGESTVSIEEKICAAFLVLFD